MNGGSTFSKATNVGLFSFSSFSFQEGFENLVTALYPKFASDRLLAGESQVVMELAEVLAYVASSL